MSMNFGREQSLLRQRLSAVGSPAAAEQLQRELGDAGTGQVTVLGAPEAEVAAAAADLVAAYPQMGRAQMTAFVRTLWQSKIHELRAVGVGILAARAELLEAADLPSLEKLLGDETASPLVDPLAEHAVGQLVLRHKKLWKDLERFVKTGRRLLRRAAVAACAPSLVADDTLWPRFAKLVEPLLADPDPALQRSIDRMLTIAATHAPQAVGEFAATHSRKIKLPKGKPAKGKAAAKAAPVAVPAVAPNMQAPSKTAPTKKAPAKKAPAKKAAKKAAAPKSSRRS